MNSENNNEIKITKIFCNHKVSAFLWTLFNWIIAITITYITDINYMYAPLLIPILNLITKELNRLYNPDFWKEIEKEDIKK